MKTASHFTFPRWVECALILAALRGLVAAQEPPSTASPTLPDPSAPSIADAPPKLVFDKSPQVRVDVLMVSLPEAKALPLIPALRDPARIDATQQRILEMIARREAELIDWPEVTTHSGKRTVIETITEWRYPIDFEQPDSPQSFGGAKRPQTPSERAEHMLNAVGLSLPLTYECKNTAATLELEPRISPDARSVTLNLAPQFVNFERMAEFSAGKDAEGDALIARQPIFRTHKVATTITLRDGERRLLHVGKPLEPEGRIVLFIVGVAVLRSPHDNAAHTANSQKSEAPATASPQR